MRTVNCLFILIIISFFSCQKLEFKNITKCNIENVQIINVNTIKVKIKITELSGGNHPDFGVCISSVYSAPEISDSIISFGIFSGPGEYEKIISNLNPATKYYLRGFVMMENTPAYSINTEEITTPSISEIITSEATNITPLGATLNAAINPKYNNLTIVFEYGNTTSYGQTIIPDIPNLNNNSITSVTASLTNLTPNSTYHFRCKATSTAGTFYGQNRFFTTHAPEPPILTTLQISNITATTASTGGLIISDGGSEISQKGVCWSTFQNPTISDFKTNDGTGKNSFYSNLINLTPGTTYYLRSYASSSAGTGYGNEISFTTYEPKVPEVITRPIVLTHNNLAKGGGTVSTDSNPIVSAYGICWSTSPNPTLNDNKTNDGSGTGSFISTLSKLVENEIYYVRAYAISNLGITYGDEVSFTNNYQNSIVTDIDGNIYHTIKIGTQVWMVENLQTTRYNDGTPITLITDNTDWQNCTTPAYCWPNNDKINYKVPYGAMYNWYVVSPDNPKKIAPEGWHVATRYDWDNLTYYLGGSNIAGGKIKENTTAYWACISPGATNSSGFSAVAAGGRISDFSTFKLYAAWWTSTLESTNKAYHYGNNCSEDVLSSSSPPLSFGYPVRCIKD